MSDRARASGFGLPSLVNRPSEYSSFGKSSRSWETSWEHHQVMASRPGVEVSDAIVVVMKVAAMALGTWVRGAPISCSQSGRWGLGLQARASSSR